MMAETRQVSSGQCGKASVTDVVCCGNAFVLWRGIDVSTFRLLCDLCMCMPQVWNLRHGQRAVLRLLITWHRMRLPAPLAPQKELQFMATVAQRQCFKPCLNPTAARFNGPNEGQLNQVR